MPASQWEMDVISCLIKSLCLPGVPKNLITMVKIFFCQETLFAVGRKPKSICNKLRHVILFLRNVFLCVRPCPGAFSSIVGLIWQDVFVEVHVVLLAEAPIRLNVLDIPSMCPGP
jgi:hypothetical protein